METSDIAQGNMICITEEQANKLSALGVVVDISYTINAGLATELSNILKSSQTTRPTLQARRKYSKRRKDNKDPFTFLHASHSLNKSAEDTFPAAFRTDGRTPAVCQQAQMNLFRGMGRTGIRKLSRHECYDILKETMPEVFVTPQRPASLPGVLFSVAKSVGFAPLWGDAGQYSTPTVTPSWDKV
tara:strand:- start:307 stop:864 length:558 start_codon:yes stop_codon:yes gene_type:complete